MLQEILNEPAFSEEMKRHIQATVEILLHKGYNFSILTNVNEISFNPPLPNDISATFKPITMFVLAGYTFESCDIDDYTITFEAGFGAENFGSFVTIPILSVLQIIVDETPILINMSVNNKDTKKEDKKGIKRSMEALLSNPENKKLFKK
jgi:hypothetical protein